MATYERYLKSIYYDPKHPASYSGVDKLFKEVRKAGKFVLDRKKIRKWLEKQEPYTVHRKVIRKFSRRKVVVPYIDYQWELDTAYMTNYTDDNDGVGYFLLQIDAFSRFIRTFPMKRVKGESVTREMADVFKRNNVPDKIQTDRGSEFKSREFQKLLKKHHIDHFYSNNETKCVMVERAIKTIKSRLARYMTHHQTHRWIDILASITDSYNKTYHRSIKMAPASVTKRDEISLWKLQYEYPKEFAKPTIGYKFKVGDTVRISHLRRPFQREYDERWSTEYFLVNTRGKKQTIAYYTITDIRGEVIGGTYYANELSKVTVDDDTKFRIEKIVRKKKREFLVKWYGWPVKFNSWIPVTDIDTYKAVKNI